MLNIIQWSIIKCKESINNSKPLWICSIADYINDKNSIKLFLYGLLYIKSIFIKDSKCRIRIFNICEISRYYNNKLKLCHSIYSVYLRL